MIPGDSGSGQSFSFKSASNRGCCLGSSLILVEIEVEVSAGFFFFFLINFPGYLVSPLIEGFTVSTWCFVAKGKCGKVDLVMLVTLSPHLP